MMVSPKPAKQLDGGKKLSLTSMYFNRYLVFRYATAIFFFINLYWLVILAGSKSFSAIIPGGLLIGTGAVMIEQVSKYWKKNNHLAITKSYYFLQIIFNLLLIVSVTLGQRALFYPFLTQQSDIWLIGFLLVGIIVSSLLEYRVYLIEHDHDRYLQNIKKFAASL